jgi:hypothetical protein
MLGASKYPRAPLDHYPTPPRATEAFLKIYGDDLPSMLVWEPFCGNGAISKMIEPHTRAMVNTDIRAYDGFDPDGLCDFFKLESLDWLELLSPGIRPDAIVTNPPYGKDAEKAARHALKLMEPEQGFVAFLCRHEWDTAKGRADLFDHPAFAAKITLRFRPRWIADSDGAPRHSYSWYCWDWTLAHYSHRPEIHYAD